MPNERHDSTSLDFEIHKEPWNIYQVSDGSRLRIRIVLKEVRRIVDGGVPKYHITTEAMIALICKPELKGRPSAATPSGDESQRNIERADIPFETIAHDNNDYLLSDDTRIKIHFNLGEVSRTALYDGNGDRVYVINHFTTTNIKLGPYYSHQK